MGLEAGSLRVEKSAFDHLLCRILFLQDAHEITRFIDNLIVLTVTDAVYI